MPAGSPMLIDLTLPISNRMLVFPGDPPPVLTPVATVAADGLALSQISMGSHTGTHIDAPAHFLADAPGIDRLPLASLVGPCRVLDVRDASGHIGRADLEPHQPRAGERLLLKTRNADLLRGTVFRKDFVAIALDGADFLVACGVVLVGIDSLSVEAFGSTDFPVHKTLLRAGVVIVEGLDLFDTAPGSYRLMALPLKMAGLDGSPARVLLETFSVL